MGFYANSQGGEKVRLRACEADAGMTRLQAPSPSLRLCVSSRGQLPQDQRRDAEVEEEGGDVGEGQGDGPGGDLGVELEGVQERRDA